MTVALCLVLACGDSASVDNDNQMAPATGGDSNGSGAGGTPSNGANQDTGGANASPEGGADTGGNAEVEGGTPGMPSIAGTGTAASCTSYTAPTGQKCGSYYCGVDLAMLTAATVPGGKCGNDLAYVCEASLPLVVGACARKIKSMNPLSSPKDLRPQVRACAYEDAEVKEKVSDDCLGCYLDSAECAGEKCLVDCLAGDSPGCDACRLKNNCTKPVFACNGLPDPL